MTSYKARLRKRYHMAPIIAKPGGEIVWKGPSSGFRIWFPPEHNPLRPGPDTSRTGTLARKLKENLVPGERYEYSMYLFEEQSLAEGNSPPIIIIQ